LEITVRLALMSDVPILKQLIPESARQLSKGYYAEQQAESSIKYIFGVDTQLILDGTYYVAEVGDEIVGCGGWSKRKIMLGGNQMKAEADPLLDPQTDAARIRAFFIISTMGAQRHRSTDHSGVRRRSQGGWLHAHGVGRHDAGRTLVCRHGLRGQQTS
jgi:hypothetical protein